MAKQMRSFVNWTLNTEVGIDALLVSCTALVTLIALV